MWRRAGGTKGESEEHGRLGLALYSSHPLNHPSFTWCHAEAVELKIRLGTITSTHKFVCNRELGSMRQHSRPNPLSSVVMERRSPFVKVRHGLVTALLCDRHWPVQPRYRYHHRKLSLIFFCKIAFKDNLLANSWATLKRRLYCSWSKGKVLLIMRNKWPTSDPTITPLTEDMSRASDSFQM